MTAAMAPEGSGSRRSPVERQALSLVEWTVTVPGAAAEAVGHILRGRAAGLVEEETPGGVALRVYLPEEEAEAVRAEVRGRLAALPEHFPGLGLRGDPFWSESERVLGTEDWAERWRDFFRPVRIGRRLVIAPAWRPASPEGGRVTVRLEPGLAFGTGQHASTRVALRLLLRALRRGDAVVDVGTGSGVLAVAAALLGAGRVFALDVDPAAVRAAAENADLNGVADRVAVRRGEWGEWPEARGNLLVANISPEVVTALASLAGERLAADGRAVLAGFLAEDAEAVAAAWVAAGWTVGRELREEGWAGLLLGRRRRGWRRREPRPAGEAVAVGGRGRGRR